MTAERSAVTFATGSRATPASAQDLRRSVAVLRERAKGTGLTGTRIGTRGGALTLTGPYAADRLRALGAPGSLTLRPVLAVDRGVASPAGSGTPGTNPVGGTGAEGVSAALRARYAALDCSHGGTPAAADPRAPVAVCAAHGPLGEPPEKYLLGPAVLTGHDVTSAESLQDPATGALWLVRLRFTAAGGTAYADAAARLARHPAPRDELATVVDGTVLSAPAMTGEPTGRTALLHGSRTETEARNLAAELDSGALPIPLRFTGARRLPGG
ncbi:hypothetical protein WN71_028680 [Streptomyces mangrovisoli]|uniref:SecDF P1 head subdomain domain-containing protein n=1 Tax=Streptomyces mangrovisoli TaxID=1428628 RepID=A0A1J4NPT2_9ACTN|nr:hypothetical protein WN71_028680 [Streptomyces mangrovisoli]